MNILEQIKWTFPPRLKKSGASIEKYDTKELIVIQCGLYPEPLIAMSDIHAQTALVLNKLEEKFQLNKFTVLTAGDMAGTLTMGTDGDPTEFYVRLAAICKEYHFVQGNHDNPDKKHLEEKLQCSTNGAYCMIQNGQTINTTIGKIAGVNGIISDKNHPYKISEDTYLKYLTKALKKKPYVLLTHDTPALLSLKGNKEIYKLVSKHRPKIHMYGHCHHNDFHYYDNNTHYFNLDSRILVFIPLNMQMEEVIIKT